jgi:hypothetical protein
VSEAAIPTVGGRVATWSIKQWNLEEIDAHQGGAAPPHPISGCQGAPSTR